jgi:asparagine synthase (glutamine-hydrolysing)
MCGIAGMIRAGGASRSDVEMMCESMAHRGPDGTGLWSDGDVALGMCRLAIIDVAHGQQPMWNEDRTVGVVLNGEIYNFRELRSTLVSKGHTFTSASDTEVIVHLYEEHGENLVDHLRGMFAFAVWDRTRERLMLARDRVGKKPLYYYESGSDILFGSELRSLLTDSRIRREVDPQALDHYLSLQYVPAPWSIIAGVKKLPPAHVLIHDRQGTHLRRYWHLSYAKKSLMTESEALEELERKVLEATKIRLISERPVGAFLSGGVDSSVVVAAMAQQSSEPVRTFSIGFGEQKFDERPFARMVAERYGTRHEEFVVTPDATDLTHLVACAFDEPFADSSALPTLVVAQLASQQVTVALNGDGGDESFGGYARYLAAPRARRLGSLAWPPAARLLARAFRDPHRAGFRGKARRALDAAGLANDEAYWRYLTYFTDSGKRHMYTPEQRARVSGSSLSLFREWWSDSDAPGLLDRMVATDVIGYLPGDLLVKVDIATMANSLEGRSPLLDQEIMEFAAALPEDLKIRDGELKYLLKALARKWVPPAVVDRPKMGFAIPRSEWLRGELRDLSWDALTDTTARQRGWFDPASVRALLEAHAGGVDHGSRIWAMLMLELWCRNWLDPTGGTTTSRACTQVDV